MEAWMWISLWVVQTIVGAIGYRKYQNGEGQIGQAPQSALILSGIVIINIISCCVLFYQFINHSFSGLYKFIDYLAGVNKKDTLKEMQKSYEKHLKTKK